MSVGRLARDDFDNARRSSAVLAVVGLLTALTTLVYVAEIDVHPDPYRALFDVAQLVAFVLPLLLAAVTYLAVAGDRGRGTVKYVLGLPNARWEYLLAKLLSRGAVATAAVLLSTAVGFAVTLATFENAPVAGRFLTYAAVSTLFALAVVGVFVALSAATASRSRAMFGVLGAYFLLVPFWVGAFPVVNLPTLLAAGTDLLGVQLSEADRLLVTNLSPARAYFETLEWVFAGVGDRYEVLAAAGEGGGPAASRPWFNALVLAGWATLAPVAGYLRFRVAEL